MDCFCDKGRKLPLHDSRYSVARPTVTCTYTTWILLASISALLHLQITSAPHAVWLDPTPPPGRPDQFSVFPTEFYLKRDYY